MDRSQGGLGVGLTLAQRLTQLHGGRVEVQSTLGQGSEFIVRLPIATTPAPQPKPPPEEPKSTGPPLRVLVVDDSVDTALSFAMLLKESGHDVWTAHDGTAAMRAALDYRPDVVLLDIGLPGLNGYEVAKWIRQQPGLPGVVLVALTGYGQESDRQASGNAGFNYHLVKPTGFKDVHEILAAVSARLEKER
jgi:CheY-like chemotaxis protein